MFTTFLHDLTHLTFKQILAKYGVPVMVAILIFNIVGNIIIMFIPLEQLPKINGKVVDVGRRETQKSNSSGNPVYAIVITLDNSRSFTIMDKDDTAKLSNHLKPGDQITIYSPSSLVNFLSDGTAHDVLQVERGRQVFFSWKDQQAKAWTLICICIFLLFFSWYLKFYWSRNVSN